MQTNSRRIISDRTGDPCEGCLTPDLDRHPAALVPFRFRRSGLGHCTRLERVSVGEQQRLDLRKAWVWAMPGDRPFHSGSCICISPPLVTGALQACALPPGEDPTCMPERTAESRVRIF